MTAYVTLAEFKQAAGISTTEWDARIEAFLESASRVVDGLAGAQPGAFAAGSTPTHRIYALRYPGERLVVDPFIRLHSVEWAVTDDASAWLDLTSSVMPAHAPTPGPGRVIIRKPKLVAPLTPMTWAAPFMPGFYRVQAVWGLSETPPASIKQAVILLAAQWWRRSQVGFAPTGIEGYGVNMRFEQDIPPDVLAIVRPYVQLIQGI